MKENIFVQRVKHFGINIFTSENVASNQAYEKEIIDILADIQREFKYSKITVELQELFKHLIIVKGPKEKAFLNKKYGITVTRWKALYSKTIDGIIIDLNMFTASKKLLNTNKLLNTLVHEIGHAIHLNFISSGSLRHTHESDIELEASDMSAKEFYDYTSKQFIDTINTVSMCDSKDEAEEHFFNLLDKCSFDFGEELENAYDERLKYQEPIRAMEETLRQYMPLDGSDDDHEQVMLFNTQEDFAENFRKYVLDNENLSHWNKNRLVYTLRKSGAQGKKIIESYSDIKKYIQLKLLCESI